MTQQPSTTSTTETATTQSNKAGKYAHLPNVCADCGKPIVGGCEPGTLGSTCAKYRDVPTTYKQAQTNLLQDKAWVTVKHLCDIAEQHGMSRGYAVRLCGGDKGNKRDLHSESFRVYTVGKRKCVRKAAVTEMVALIEGKGKPSK